MEKTAESLINKVKKCIDDHSLLKSGDRVLLALSGGADSIALTEILRTLSVMGGWQVGACHVNHHMRGKEADEDALWVGNFCRMRGIKCFLEDVDVPKLIAEGGYSPEEAARILRYDALRKVAAREGYDCIAVAHNHQDNAETFLLNLLRGSGIEGLTGMQPRQGDIIRPFLAADRQDIEFFCQQHKIAFRKDSSNKNKNYLRNRVRLELLPHMEEFNPAIVDVLGRTSAILESDADFLRTAAGGKFAALMLEDKDAVSLPLDALTAEHKAMSSRIIALAINHVLGDAGYIASKHIAKVRELLLSGRTGAILDMPGGLKVKKTYDELIFSTKTIEDGRTAPIKEQPLPIPGRVVLPDGRILRASLFRGARPRTNGITRAAFPASVAGSELIVRSRQPGDLFQPSGMGGARQKLKEFFIDSKVPQEERDGIPLVCDQEGVLWVAGLRCAHRNVPAGDSWLYLELINKEYVYV